MSQPLTRSGQRSRTRLPFVVRLLAFAAVLVVVIPILGLVVRAPWNDFGDTITNPDVGRALGLSVATSVVAAIVAVTLGVPLAWWLVETSTIVARWVRAVVLLALVTPPVVAGVALLAAYGRRGIIGEWLDDALDVQVAFTTAAVIIAQVFVSLPLVVLTAESAFAQRDREVEDAARTLGGSAREVMWRVTLPNVRPALAAAAALAWGRSMGEFGATITFAGNLPGTTQTLPLRVYLELQDDPGAALLVAVVLGLTCLLVLVGLRGSWWGGVRR